MRANEYSLYPPAVMKNGHTFMTEHASPSTSSKQLETFSPATALAPTGHSVVPTDCSGDETHEAKDARKILAQELQKMDHFKAAQIKHVECARLSARSRLQHRLQARRTRKQSA